MEKEYAFFLKFLCFPSQTLTTYLTHDKKIYRPIAKFDGKFDYLIFLAIDKTMPHFSW